MSQPDPEQEWAASTPVANVVDVAGGPPPNPLHPVPIADLMAMKLPERQTLLPWLPEGGLIMVYGPRGVGKTFFTASLAVSLACGEPFLKWKPTAAAGVLLVDGEMAVAELRERLTELLPHKPAASLEIVSHEIVFDKTEKDLNLGVPEWQEATHQYLEDHPDIRVVIFDNLGCLLPTIAEDKRDEWSNHVLPFLIALRRRGVAAIMVHHAGKGGDQRGTSSREDTLNTVIRLKRLPGHDATTGARFVVEFTKSRGCYGDDVKPIEARLDTEQDGRPCWTWKPYEMGNEERLIEAVRDGIDNVKDAAEELEVTSGAISKIKKRLQRKGELAPGRQLKIA